MEKYIKQYELLFKKAKTDLKVAKILFRDFEKGDTELDLEVIFYHLQQCAEKLLKSVLSNNKIDFPKVHDIEVLINLINENSINLNVDKSFLVNLTDYAVEGRYIVIHDDLENTNDYIKLLENLIKEVKKQL